jgi:hypothetical protein
MHRNHGNGDRRVLMPALVALCVFVAVGVAQAVTREIDGFGLAAGGRGWDFEPTDAACILDPGFAPVEDGTLATGRLGDDAFDGGLLVGVDGTGFVDGDGQGDLKKKAKAFAFAVGPDSTGALTVARTEVAKGHYLRSLIRLTNPSASPFTGTISWDSDLGSDGDEVTQASSSGDRSFTDADRWVVSSEPGANAWEDDPTLTFVLYGKGARARDTVVDGPGSNCLTVNFESLQIPGNATRYLLFYTEMSAHPRVARRAARKYDDRGLSSRLLEGISRKVRAQILNWDL